MIPAPAMSHWFAYKDEEGYWIERSGAPPCLILWTPLPSIWERAIQAIRENSGSVSHLRSLVVRDPIYEYVYVPPPVAYLLTPSKSRRGPLFIQRLRYVKQNGASYLVFPSLRSARFEHSLGAMELARRVSDSAFQRSDTSTIGNFAAKVRRDFSVGPEPNRSTPWLACFRQIDDKKEDLAQSVEAWDARLEDWVEREIGTVLQSAQLRVRAVGQLSAGARHVVGTTAANHLFKLTACLVALLHDVGHLPFSHTLEDPLQELLEEKGKIHRFPTIKVSSKKLHERISLDIIRYANDLFTSEAWRIAVVLSLLAQESTLWEDSNEQSWVNSSVFGTLHGIVSSEVERERCCHWNV